MVCVCVDGSEVGDEYINYAEEKESVTDNDGKMPCTLR